MKITLYIATIISIVTYLFWEALPKGSFYIGNGLFIFLLCMVLYRSNKMFITYFLACISLSNLLDELFFNPRVLGWNELALIIVVPAIWLYRNRNETKFLGRSGSIFF